MHLLFHTDYTDGTRIELHPRQPLASTPRTSTQPTAEFSPVTLNLAPPTIETLPSWPGTCKDFTGATCSGATCPRRGSPPPYVTSVEDSSPTRGRRSSGAGFRSFSGVRTYFRYLSLSLSASERRRTMNETKQFFKPCVMPTICYEYILYSTYYIVCTI